MMIIVLMIFPSFVLPVAKLVIKLACHSTAITNLIIIPPAIDSLPTIMA